MAPNPIFSFEDAVRQQAKASIMIEGLSGMGKSGLALLIAYALSGKDWTKVYACDTEQKSLNLFAEIPSSLGVDFCEGGRFKVGQLTEDIGYKPSNYLAFREAALAAGATAFIEDSISHAWMYKGGVLDLVNEAQTNLKNSKDKYGAWRDPKVQEEKQKLLTLIRDARIHIISTVRVKEEFVPDKDDEGKSIVKSLGEQQIMQDDIKYEPDLVLHMTQAGYAQSKPIVHPKARVVKSRYAIFQKDQEYEFTPELLDDLRKYLEEGADPKELLQRQHEEYVAGMTEYLDAHPNARTIWQVIKKDAGFEQTKLSEIPLDALKPLFLKLTT